MKGGFFTKFAALAHGVPSLPPFVVLFAFLSSSRQPLSVESSVNSTSGPSLAGRLRGISPTHPWTLGDKKEE